eukprot:TRINITY_DN29229_c0_g1_i1.p1 TRINITY_DN29229_c0_g1~~TRINITY_DN29229_c0_g1_i1.p1  ORF type:complete len:744 (+),score=75.47 TRINITY_DN29229_c0_g1_i1:36-2267(+)
MAAVDTSSFNYSETNMSSQWTRTNANGDGQYSREASLVAPLRRHGSYRRVWWNMLTIVSQFCTSLPYILSVLQISVTSGSSFVTYLFSLNTKLCQHNRTLILEIGFGSAFVCLLLYFLCEDGPCHYTRDAEAAWLSFVIGLFSFTGSLVSVQLGPTQLFDALSVWLINMQLFNKAKKCRMHPKFHERVNVAAGGSPNEVTYASPKELRMLAKLELALGEAWEKKSYINGFVISDSHFPVLIFIVHLLKISYVPDNPTKDLNTAMLNSAIELCCMIIALLYLYGFVDTMFKRAFAGPSVLKLVNLVEELTHHDTAKEIEFVLTNLSVATLFEVTDWRAAQCLTQNRLLGGLLTTRSKAVIIDGIQKFGLRSYKAQNAVKQIFLSCQGEDLTAVKNLLDGSNTYQNLHYLIHHNIMNTSIRLSILFHFSTQARIAREEAGHRLGIKVLSDIDDTFFSSGGKFPAGCDKRYPKHVIYPGLLSFLDVLDRKRIFDIESCNLVFLSARPHLYQGVSEDRTYKSLRSVFKEKGRQQVPTLLPGSLRSGLQAVAGFWCLRSRAWKPVGNLKYKTYLTFRALYPEYDFVFFGDNGQGDLWAGQKMMECNHLLAASEPRLLAVLIHRVIPDANALAMQRRSQEGPGWARTTEDIFMHETYVGAALALHTKHPDLVNLRDLASVAEAAIQDFDDMRLLYCDWHRQWDEAFALLGTDISNVDAILKAKGAKPLSRLVSTSELLRSSGECSDARP